MTCARLISQCHCAAALLSLAFFSPLAAEQDGYYLMPEAPRGELVQFLSSPLLDRSVLVQLADRAESSVRKSLGERRAAVVLEICRAGEAERPALRKARLEAVHRQHAAYRLRLEAAEDHTMRRMEKEIEPALREEAVRLRKIAYQMQKERQLLIERSWSALLESQDCEPGALFPEKLMMPYYLSLFHYQSIFPPERRFGSLLLLKDDR